MKIICIGRNYLDHAKELNNEVPSSPLVFMKPPSALLLHDKPFFHPEFSENIHFEGEVVLRIGKNGKYIQREFALSYINGIAYGIDFTARDLQDQVKSSGHPWEIAKAFDHSAAVSEFIPTEGLDLKNINLQTFLNGNEVQNGNTKDLIFDFETILIYVSQYFTLQMGDIIFTGTPAGVGKISIGDVLEGYINGNKLLNCIIK